MTQRLTRAHHHGHLMAALGHAVRHEQGLTLAPAPPFFKIEVCDTHENIPLNKYGVRGRIEMAHDIDHHRAQSTNHRDINAQHGPPLTPEGKDNRSEEHTSELQSRGHLVCRLLLE